LDRVPYGIRKQVRGNLDTAKGEIDMIKRVVLLLATVAMAGGMVWAQPTPGDAPDVFHNFNAVPTLSTEARYSAGRFRTDVDNFIDTRFHNPEIGTFLFLGGFPSMGRVDITDVLTPGTPADAYTLSFGFGHSFNLFYLGVYYGGSLVNARGGSLRDLDENVDWDRFGLTEAEWRNNLAVLVGILNMGIRLDLIVHSETTRRTIDGSLGPGGVHGPTPPTGPGEEGWTVEAAPSIALSWGMRMGPLAPHAQIGVNFRDTTVWRWYVAREEYVPAIPPLTGTDQIVVRYERMDYRVQTGGNFRLAAGASFDLNEEARVGGTLRFGSMFASRDRFRWDADGDLGGTDSVRGAGGAWGLGFEAYYAQTIDAGLVGFGFRPRLDAQFVSVSNNNSLMDSQHRLAPHNFFTLGLGVDAGLRVRPTQRLAFFTGVGLSVFEWNTASRGSSSTERDAVSQWTFRGISWEPDRTTYTGHLGFGMTLTPVQNVVIGFGLNTIIDRFVRIDLYRMRIDTGGADSWWSDAGDASNSVGALAGIFSDITLDFTVSIRLGGNNGNNGNRAAAAPRLPLPLPHPPTMATATVTNSPAWRQAQILFCDRAPYGALQQVYGTLNRKGVFL